MTAANYTRPNYTTQSGTAYPANIDAMAKVFERIAGAFAPHEQTAGSPAPDLTVIVDAGPVLDLSGSAPDLNEMAQQTVSGFTIPSAGQTRIDRVVMNHTTGQAMRIAGTAVTTGGSPSAAPPDIPVNTLPVCQVAIASSDTAITNDMITDERSGIPIGAVTEAMQVLADNVTNDVSISKHGYAPKAPNNTTMFLRADGTWATPAGSSVTGSEGITVVGSDVRMNTNNSVGVGAYAWMMNISGATIANGATIAATSLRMAYGAATTGIFTNSGISATGTWRNVTGLGLGAGEDFGLFIRTA